MNFQRFAFVLAFAFIGLSFAMSNSVVDVRMQHNTLNKAEKTLYVDIDVRVDNKDHLNLAGQNYRIFYPSGILSLDQADSKSQLPRQQYSPLLFSSVVENVAANGQGAIAFDDNLGFANFSVELLNDQQGGYQLSSNDGWVTIATLKFDVLEEIEEVSMIWGREGMSESYATAFVEIAAWEAPLQTSTVIIDEYIDFNLRINSISLDEEIYDISVGPNPSTDFVTITANKEINADLEVWIRDLAGRLIQINQLQKGSIIYSIDVSNLQSASYILDINDKKGQRLFSKKIVVAQ